MKRAAQNIVGFEVTVLSTDKCVEEVLRYIDVNHFDDASERCHWLACINPHSYVVSLSDPLFSQALHDAELLIPDGIGMVWASKISGGKIRNRITGSDIFEDVHKALNKKGAHSVFFLGATEETLNTISERMAIDFPSIHVSGTYSPPFKTEYSAEENDAMIELINTAKPDVLWVGMTAPKQEKWIYQNRDRLNVKFAGAIGAVFDFYAGRVKRSHPHFQRLGLEWLPRLIQEPRRLWRRMLVSAPVFVWHVARSIILRK